MYPGAIPVYAGFTSSHTLAADNHAAQSNAGQTDIIALATKVGTGASTPTSGVLLRGNGAGTSAWAPVGLTTDVTGVLPTANGGTGGQTNFLAIIYPVGCVYAETTGVNPGTTFGFGTWVAFGKGQVLIGAGTSDQVFTAGASGGESNHGLTIAELASHTHTVTDPTHAHGPSSLAFMLTDNAVSVASGASFFKGADHSTSTAAASTGVTNQNTGSGTAHNNLQPYIVIYYWNRTA